MGGDPRLGGQLGLKNKNVLNNLDFDIKRNNNVI